jgi:DNA-binding LacI/PurR family transcriptional regulator
MPLPREITIHDIAQAAGVSTATVSRVINQKPDVSRKTRVRVQQVIDELGYTPYVQVAPRTAGRKPAIALLYPMHKESRAGFTQTELDFMIGAANSAGSENFFLNLITTPMTQDELENLAKSSQIDGIILMEPQLRDWRIELLREQDIPFVMIGRCEDNTGLSFVDIDFIPTVMMAFDHLVALGHRHIGYLTYSADMHDARLTSAVRSWQGYEAALNKHGLEPCFQKARMGIMESFEATRALLTTYPQITAFVGMYGGGAAGIFGALHQLNRGVPDDVSVVAIGTENIAIMTTPALTTVDLPGFHLADQAVRMLIRKLRQEPLDLEQIVLPPKLTIRGSTGTV